MKFPDYCSPNRDVDFSQLVGKTLVEINGSKGSDSIHFTCSDGDEFHMWHEQSCCESVTVEDICGDWEDILNSPVLKAEVSTNLPEGFVDPYAKKDTDEYYYRASFTWTFYRITTMLGQVVIRWYGTSNGYYSESVSFCKYDQD